MEFIAQDALNQLSGVDYWIALGGLLVIVAGIRVCEVLAWTKLKTRIYQIVWTVIRAHDKPQEWALTQNNLGVLYSEALVGDSEENQRRAIEHFESALRVCSETRFPSTWAMAQCDLGLAYWRLWRLPVGDRAENLRRSIDYSQAALSVLTRTNSPDGWPSAHYNLGLAKWDAALIRHDRSVMVEARDHFALAAPAYDMAGMSDRSIKAKQHQAEVERALGGESSVPP